MKLSDLLPRVARAVRAVVPDAPENMLVYDLSTAVAQLFTDLRLMQRSITIDLQESVADYLLDECPGERLRWGQLEQAPEGYEIRPERPHLPAQVGQPHYVAWNREHHTVTVSPTPTADAVAGMTLIFTVIPTGLTAGDTIPGNFDDQEMQDALVAAAAHRALMDLAPAAAEPHGRRYDAMLTRLTTRRILGWSGNTTARMTATPGFIAR